MKLRVFIAILLLCLLVLACSSLNGVQIFGVPVGAAVTATPTPTAIPPTPTPTPTPPPTPTPVPAVRVELGDASRFKGDWEQAQLEYQTALDSSPERAGAERGHAGHRALAVPVRRLR